VIPAAFFLSGRAAHKAITRQAQAELVLPSDQEVRYDAARAVQHAVSSIGTADQLEDKAIISLLVAAEAVHRSGTHPLWVPILTELMGGAPLPDRVRSAAKVFTNHRWNVISQVFGELCFCRHVAVSKLFELCGVRLAA
jgi:hypothetical protein